MEMVRKTDGKTKRKGKNIKRKKNFHYISSETNKTETRRTHCMQQIEKQRRQKYSLKKLLRLEREETVKNWKDTQKNRKERKKGKETDTNFMIEMGRNE